MMNIGSLKDKRHHGRPQPQLLHISLFLVKQQIIHSFEGKSVPGCRRMGLMKPLKNIIVPGLTHSGFVSFIKFFTECLTTELPRSCPGWDCLAGDIQVSWMQL